MSEPVIVGVDLGGGCSAAVRWAAVEARRRGTSLTLVHGHLPPVGGFPGQSMVGVGPRQGLVLVGERALADAALLARDAASEVSVDTALVERDAVSVLSAHARHAALVVIGSDRLGALGERVLGGVARALAGHIDVPLAVVPRDADREAPERLGLPVIAGDDGTAGSRPALQWAAQRARERGVPLVVVRAGDGQAMSTETPELGADGPPVELVVAEGRADRVLADQARHGEVVVLGTSASVDGRGPTRRRLARCLAGPIVVVPAEASTAS